MGSEKRGSTGEKLATIYMSVLAFMFSDMCHIRTALRPGKMLVLVI